MDLLLDFIVELVAEGCCEIAESKKVSKWIRYPIIFILSVAILSVIVFVGFLGVKMIMSTEQYSIYGGLLLILIDVIFIIYGTGKIIKKLKLRKSDR
ncbi:MAG: hypothetical protein ACI4XP_10845 [Acutalibacteraceae bacterium]